MRSLLTVMAGAIVLSGCTSGTGILPAGPDTYTVTKKVSLILGGGNEAEKEALTGANDFCEQKGLKFVPNTMGAQPSLSELTPGAYSVLFRCLSPNDPAVTKYQLGQAPNVIVEQRNR